MSTVTVKTRPWNSDHAAAPDEEVTALLVESIEVDGVPLPRAQDVVLRLDGFATITINDPPDAMSERYGPDEWLRETESGRLVLPVSQLTYAEEAR